MHRGRYTSNWWSAVGITGNHWKHRPSHFGVLGTIGIEFPTQFFFSWSDSTCWISLMSVSNADLSLWHRKSQRQRPLSLLLYNLWFHPCTALSPVNSAVLLSAVLSEWVRNNKQILFCLQLLSQYLLTDVYTRSHTGAIILRHLRRLRDVFQCNFLPHWQRCDAIWW